MKSVKHELKCSKKMIAELFAKISQNDEESRRL